MEKFALRMILFNPQLTEERERTLRLSGGRINSNSQGKEKKKPLAEWGEQGKAGARNLSLSKAELAPPN